MKRIFQIFIVFLLSLTLFACDEQEELITHQMVFDVIAITYQEGDTSLTVTKHVTLPTIVDFEGVTIEWESSNPNIISTAGQVNRPSGQNASVMLTLFVTINGVTEERNFPHIVLATTTQQETFYTVTFDSAGGSLVSSVQVLKGGLITEPTEPTRAEYEFDGWYKNQAKTVPWNFDTDTVEANTTLYANWISLADPTYIVTFNTNGGSIVPNQTVEEDGLVTAPVDPVKANNNFAGWFKDADLTIPWDFDEDSITQNTIIYAKWEPIPITYTVSFVTNGGSELSPASVAENNVLDEPTAPTRDGYDFAGWFKEASFETPWDFEEDSVTGNVTLYALWRPEGSDESDTVYVVTFDTTGGNDVALEFVLEGSLLTEPAAPTRFGFEFLAWYKDEALTETWDFDVDTVTTHVTLYADWHELPPMLPAPVHGIGHQPRPVAHIAIGPYEFEEGLEGGFIGYVIRFINETTGEEFLWHHDIGHSIALSVYYTEGNLSAAGIVLTPGNYTLKYYAKGNGVTTSDSFDSNYTVDFIIPFPQLAKPNLSILSETLQISTVPNAEQYDLYVNDELVEEAIESGFDLTQLELEVGVYTIKVVVTSTTGYLENFNTVEYIVSSGELTKLDAPQNVTLEGDLLSWDTVDNASGYQVIMNGITQSTNDTSYNLKNFPISGTFDVVVVAVGDQIFYANSDASDALEYEAQAAPPLNPINAGDFVAMGMADGHVGFHFHGGATSFLNQAGFDDAFFIQIINSSDEVVFEVTKAYTGSTGNIVQISWGGWNAQIFAGLPSGTYTISVELVAAEDSGFRNSVPHTFNVTKP